MTTPDDRLELGGRTAWVNCSVGVAGDMLLAGLIDAGADRLSVMEAWSRLELDGFAASWERVERCGVAALWTNLVVDHGHQHPGDGPEAHQHHSHRPAAQVIEMLAKADLSARVRADAIRVYRMLAEVEANIHQEDPGQVELHEVGALDSILDVVGVCAAMHALDIDDLSYSPVGLGAGTVRSAHGELPHPAPATVQLLSDAGAAVVGVDTTLETATPTGVALLSALGVPTASPPTMQIETVGYGAGTADPAERANIVQVLVGRRVPEQPDDGQQPAAEPLVVIETNLDDTSGEVISYAIERLLATGALDAWATPIMMKKGRPATTMHALARPADVGPLRDVLFSETGTLGVRVRPVERVALDRTQLTVEVGGHPVRVKVAGNRFKVEFDDAAAAARSTGQPLRVVIAEAERTFRDRDRTQ